MKLIVWPFLLSACCSLQAQTILRTMNHLPDTGQEGSYTNTPGEDSDFFVFAPSYTVNTNGTVTDDNTGLMWQKLDGGEISYEQAIEYADSLTLAGYEDWRLPSAHELMSIQDLQQSNPSIDTQSFADTDAEYWWSGDAQANDPNKIWVTNAGGGIGNHPKTETISAGGTHRFHVRAVRQPNMAVAITTRFISNGDGTVMDTMTDLIWQQSAPEDSLTWEQALQWADTATLAGYSDWRLPNIKEMHSINQENLINPSIDSQWTGVNESRKWWSSTTLANDAQKAWYLFSRFGITTYDLKTNQHFIRLVRSGDATSSVIEDRIEPNNFYPNPVSDMLYCAQASATCRVYDCVGQCVLTLTGSGPWNMKGLASGTYYVREADSTQIVVILKQ